MKKITILSLSLSIVTPMAVISTAHAEIKKAPAPSGLSAESKNELAKIFDGKLTDAEGKAVSSDSLKKAKYIAVYFSAQWCPPCRAFTPKLVSFVEENRKGGNFELVFVSSDSTTQYMQDYMKKAKMPWGGVQKKEIQEAGLDKGILGIPHLRVFDNSGEIVIDSVKDGKYVGPNYVLDELKKKLQ